jgi:hypothetical protein
VEIGGDVLVVLIGDQGAVFGELQWRSVEAIGLRQFNPSAEFEIGAGEIAEVHCILGELI